MAMGKPMKGLLLIAGKPPKGKSMPADEEGPEPASERGGGSEDLSLSEAYQAVQDGDEPAFKAAMLRAIRACIAKEY